MIALKLITNITPRKAVVIIINRSFEWLTRLCNIASTINADVCDNYSFPIIDDYLPTE